MARTASSSTVSFRFSSMLTTRCVGASSRFGRHRRPSCRRPWGSPHDVARMDAEAGTRYDFAVRARGRTGSSVTLGTSETMRVSLPATGCSVQQLAMSSRSYVFWPSTPRPRLASRRYRIRGPRAVPALPVTDQPPSAARWPPRRSVRVRRLDPPDPSDPVDPVEGICDLGHQPGGPEDLHLHHLAEVSHPPWAGAWRFSRRGRSTSGAAAANPPSSVRRPNWSISVAASDPRPSRIQPLPNITEIRVGRCRPLQPFHILDPCEAPVGMGIRTTGSFHPGFEKTRHVRWLRSTSGIPLWGFEPRSPD